MGTPPANRPQRPLRQPPRPFTPQYGVAGMPLNPRPENRISAAPKLINVRNRGKNSNRAAVALPDTVRPIAAAAKAVRRPARTAASDSDAGAVLVLRYTRV